ncbi:MAG: hypothetical protein AAF907_07025, partial [Planctomycetota bacterium]
MPAVASLIAAATLILAPQPPAGDRPEQPDAERVAALVEALSAPRRSERIRAERALIALGPAVVDQLPADGSTNAAVTAALER